MKEQFKRTNKLNDGIIELIEWHLPGRSRDTITWYESFTHDTVYNTDEEGNIDWLISYFTLDFPFDTMVVMQRYNRFPKIMWRILRDTVSNPVKPIRIMSDPTNEVLVKMTKKYGGEWHQDELWFY